MLLFIYLILTVLFLGVGMLLYHAPEELLAKYNINPIISNSLGVALIIIGVWFAISFMSTKISNKLLNDLKPLQQTQQIPKPAN